MGQEFITGLAVRMACGWPVGFGSGALRGTHSAKRTLTHRLDHAIAAKEIPIPASSGQALPGDAWVALLNRNSRKAT